MTEKPAAPSAEVTVSEVPRPVRAKVFTPRNRLAKITTAHQTASVAELVAGAEAQLTALGPSLKAGLFEAVAEIVRLCRQPEAEVFAASREIGWLALSVAETAKLADRSALADVALGVWELVEALVNHGVWHTDALMVQVQTLRILATDVELSEADLRLIESRLAQMRLAIGVEVS